MRFPFTSSYATTRHQQTIARSKTLGSITTLPLFLQFLYQILDRGSICRILAGVGKKDFPLSFPYVISAIKDGISTQLINIIPWISLRDSFPRPRSPHVVTNGGPAKHGKEGARLQAEETGVKLFFRVGDHRELVTHLLSPFASAISVAETNDQRRRAHGGELISSLVQLQDGLKQRVITLVEIISKMTWVHVDE